MSRSQAILAATLLLAIGWTSALAGDFVPRATNSYAAIGDDPGTRASCPDAGSSAPMNEVETSVRNSPGPADAPPATPARSAKHIGVDDAATDTHAAAATTVDSDDKPVPTTVHKPRSALRWQSLLPGVMK